MCLDYLERIKKRDGNKCILCLSKYNLHVHHIETVGSGWADERFNMVTLCFSCHRDCAHWSELAYYKAVFLDYVQRFPRPLDWDDVVLAAKLKRESVKKRQRSKQKELREKQKQYAKKTAAPQKSQYQRQKEYYEKKYGMSPRKYQYKKSKWLI